MTGHRLFTLAALTLLAVACNREAISPYEEGQERLIDFSAYFAQDATKARGEINEFANKDSIGVFACYTGDRKYDLTSVSSDFMYDQKVTLDGSNWTYNPVKYWPNNEFKEYISFFSYYPYISSEKALEAEDGIIGFSKSYAKGDPWLVFRLPKTAPYTQTDLMYGKALIDVTKQDQWATADSVLSFQFKHALACIADSVTVQMSQDLYTKMHDSLDISITGLRIVYSNLTNKACLVLNSTDEPIWKEVISGELQTSRTYVPESFTTQTFSKNDAADKVLTIDEGHGLFYIPLQIQGQPKPEIRVTLSYTVIGVEDHGSFTDSVVTVKQFDPSYAGKKQRLALTLSKDFNLDADIITEASGISMADDLLAGYEDVKIDYTIKPDTLTYKGNVQTFTAPRTGKYKLEAWGAKGGRGAYNSSTSPIIDGPGAVGGYATAEFELSIGDVLYVYVGGKGEDADSQDYKYGGRGGWNGGGNGGDAVSFAYSGGGGGGGATHIAMSDIGAISGTTFKLSDYDGTVGHLLLVAAGGGGGSSDNNDRRPGAGGGETGNRGGIIPSDQWNNGEVSHGADGGDGISSGVDREQGNGGGGGGYIGGSANSFTTMACTGGSGGSSMANKSRYNYVSNSFSTVSGISPTPDQSGNGMVVITFVNSL